MSNRTHEANPDAIDAIMRDISAGRVAAPARSGKSDVLRTTLDQGAPINEVLGRAMDGAVGVYAAQMREALKHPPPSRWVLWGDLRYAGGRVQVVVMPMAREDASQAVQGPLRESISQRPPSDKMTATLSLFGQHVALRDLPLALADRADELLRAAAEAGDGAPSEARHEVRALGPEEGEAAALRASENAVGAALARCAERLAAGDVAFEPANYVVRVDARDPGAPPRVSVCARSEVGGDLAAAVGAELASAPLPPGGALILLVTAFRKSLSVRAPSRAG